MPKQYAFLIRKTLRLKKEVVGIFFKKIFLILLLFIIPSIAFSQFRSYYGVKKQTRKSKIKKSHLDAGVVVGPIFSLTDIGGSGTKKRPLFLDIQYGQTQFFYGAFARYRILPIDVAISTGIYHGTLSGSDLLSPGTSRYLRGFSFTNSITEWTTKGEYFLPISKFTMSRFDYYVGLGATLLFHNPKLSMPDSAENLNPPGLVYKKGQLAIPMSAGVVYTFPNNMFRVGLDVSWRKTFTDYLDGFTRPWAKHKDSYMMATVNGSYIIGKVGKSYNSHKPSYYKAGKKKSSYKRKRKKRRSSPKY